MLPHESLAQMTAYKDPARFLKALITHLGDEERHPLCEHLAKAERDQRCIRRAVFLMAVLLMLSGGGLGFCAILQPEVLSQPDHLVTHSLLVLGLGSLISQGTFLVYLLWHRTEVTRLHQECRRLVLALDRSQLKMPAFPSLTAAVPAQSTSAFPQSTAPPSGVAPHHPLS